MNKEMTVNGKSYTIIKLLGKGKGGYLTWQSPEITGMF